jgi:lactoylglutathione lyase
MIKIHHIGIWVSDLEKIKNFYESFFSATSNEKYINAKTGFSSYMLSFQDGSKVEIMNRPNIKSLQGNSLEEYMGWAHIAVCVGSRKKVNQLTERFRNDGYIVAGESRVTGDGFFESVILDPEGNRIELTE